MARAGFFKQMEKGQIHSATIEEIISVTEAICNFRGDLLRISNHTNIEMRIGDVIRLQVKNLEPLEFQVFDTKSLRFERVV